MSYVVLGSLDQTLLVKGKQKGDPVWVSLLIKTTEFPRLAGVATRGLKMLGDFLTRILILLLGYAYPGFECYKAVEKNRVEIEELRFWCQYWIIVAIFTVVEKFTDIFISWLPMYGEMKLALIIYMWYPKTKGTGYIYKSILRPVVARHENEIDRKLMEWRARVWDLTIFYWQNCAQLGHSAFFQGLEYLATQSRFSTSGFAKKNDGPNQNEPQWPSKGSDKETNLTLKNIKRPPSPPPSPGRYINRNMSLTPRGRTVQIRLDSQENNESGSPRTPRPRAQDDLTKDSLNQARTRLRRLNTAN
ncbi:hypothetical protein L6164_033942 [Bauhinia variegata]|uniref:Uncharacterized protein n=1 Tax=Bauhinia variegata TaxID=167791 RepID=A0ACB9KU23_BAUVA|nr:hypothetical protein L6164_033942 [Bauhinia variegata]